jgi:putative ABC transport system permease protein
VNLLVGAATIGLILAPVVLGVFISYRLYRWLDLTVDGSFGLGAAVVAALLVRDVSPVIATAAGTLAGATAGALTGVLHTRLQVTVLLAGVLMSTALYSVILFIMGSGNLSLASADSLVAQAQRAGERMGLSADFGVLLAMALVAAALGMGLALFLGTDLGLAMRASGSNPQMAKSVGIDVDGMVVLGLAVSNGLVALAGALFAQYSGFSNIQMGIGAIVTGVAALLVGETLVRGRSLGRCVAAAIAGAVIYRLAVAGALRAGLNPNALKLVTALLVLAVLVVPDLARRARRAHA